eukprot:GFYU01007390.1.p1 GENE.GFYU01007390.1~~GFYU01007390.1.p1  ORF type:complete len:484 (-),score=112.77 GFYU01007390.1:194-1645(-)
MIFRFYRTLSVNMVSAKSLEYFNTLLAKSKQTPIKFGLDNIKTVLEALNRPQDKVPIVHITGTNGKGSVCAFVESMLSHAGYKVGRFTSPHLIDWTECIHVGGKQISDGDFEVTLDRVESAAATHGVQLAQFEALTAAAFAHFDDSKVDIAIVEVGMGGRLDATNVCDKPAAAVITSVGLDHERFLGSTVGAVATEKAGILKPNCPAILGPLVPEALEAAKKLAGECSIVVEVQPAAVLDTDMSSGRSSMQWLGELGEYRYTPALAGHIQAVNSAVAIATVEQLVKQDIVSAEAVQAAAVDRAMVHTRWPGRMQTCRVGLGGVSGVSGGATALLDGAHNPAAALGLKDHCDRVFRSADGVRASKNVTWVIGMLGGKDHTQFLKTLLQPGDSVTFVPVPVQGAYGLASASPDALKELVMEAVPELKEVTVAKNVEDVIPTLTDDNNNVICGSLYLVGHVINKAVVPDAGAEAPSHTEEINAATV